MERDQLNAWVLQARSGDHEAFGQLVEATWSSLVAFLRTVLAERHADAEDAAQDTYCRAWRSLSTLRDPRAFLVWIRRIGLREAKRRLKKSNGQIELRSLSRSNSDQAPPQPPNQRDGDLVRALARLPTRQRAVLHLGEIEGFSDEEVAASLGIGKATVRVHRRRGRLRLRRLLEGSSGDE